MSNYNQYDEGIASRSAQFRGGAVGGNLTNNLGAQPGNSNTAAGGNQVIATSSNIDGNSKLDTPFSINNIPNDPKAYASSNVSSAFVGQSLGGESIYSITAEYHNQLVGTTSGTKTIALTHAGVQAISSVYSSGSHLVAVVGESHTQVVGTTSGTKTVLLSNTGVADITLITNSTGSITYSGVGVVPSGAGWTLSGNNVVWTNGSYADYTDIMASGWVPSGSATFKVNYDYSSSTPIVYPSVSPSGAGWSLNGDSIVWTNGSYTNYTAIMASGWVPSGSASFGVDYTYGTDGDITTTNTNITSLLPSGRQQAFLGNVGPNGAGSSFGGSEITR